MRGHNSPTGPFPKTLSFDNGSASNDTSTNQQTSWNNMHNSVRIRSSNHSIAEDLNITAECIDNDSDDCHILEAPQIPSSSSSNLLPDSPSGSGRLLTEEALGRSNNMLGSRRISCKRRALDRNNGQSSKGASSSSLHHAQGSVWRAIPSSSSANNCSLSISNPLENAPVVDPSLNMSRISSEEIASESPVARNSVGNNHSSLRSYCSRTSRSHRVDSAAVSLPLTRISPQLMSSSSFAPDNLLGMRSPSVMENSSSQRQPVVPHVSSSRRTTTTTTTNPSSLRHGNALSFRNVEEQHPMFTPSNYSRIPAQNTINWSLMGGDSNTNTSAASSSDANRVSRRDRPQYPRSLSELVRRSLLASAARSDNGGVSQLPMGAASQGVPISSVTNSRSRRLLRPGILLDRHRNGAIDLPYSLPALSAVSEGSGELASEIHNVFGLMRRGENLSLEDIVMLDHSVLFGMVDIRDRHRDMRLDVDNMSYEELLALGERIGNVGTGLSEKTIMERLRQRKYFSIAMSTQLEIEPCCVCQEEYNDGEDVGTLECGHEFHSGCIKEWLTYKNLCPICKTTALSS